MGALGDEAVVRSVPPPPPAEELIPRELIWIYPIVPLATAPLFLGGPFSLFNLVNHSFVTVLALVATLYVPFFSFSGACHLLYRKVLPRPMQRLSRPARWTVHVAVIIGVPVVLAPGVRILDELLYPRSLMPLGDYTLVSIVFTALFIVPSVLVQDFRNRRVAAEQQVVEAKQARLRAQLEALQARTNPHFFFNAVNTVAALIPEDPKLAERTLERLADLFRYTLDSAKTPTVPLSREMDVIRDYLAIQGARYGSRLISSVSVEPTTETVAVPPLLLQPLVENAILHGMAGRLRGEVHVRVTRGPGQVRIEVQDDGPGPAASTHQGSQTSVNDLRARLRLAYGESASFELKEATGGGALACVELPVEG